MNAVTANPKTTDATTRRARRRSTIGHQVVKVTTEERNVRNSRDRKEEEVKEGEEALETQKESQVQ